MSESIEVGWQLSYFTVSKRSSALHHWNTAAWFHHRMCVCVCVREWRVTPEGRTHPNRHKQLPKHEKMQDQTSTETYLIKEHLTQKPTNWHRYFTLSSLNQFHWALNILSAFSYCQSHLRCSIFRCLRTCGFALGLNAGQEFRKPEHRADTYGFSFRFTEVHKKLTHCAIFVYSYVYELKTVNARKWKTETKVQAMIKT